jgi:hypothetical protein
MMITAAVTNIIFIRQISDSKVPGDGFSNGTR